jgi:hypothetical protein
MELGDESENDERILAAQLVAIFLAVCCLPLIGITLFVLALLLISINCSKVARPKTFDN